MKVLSKKEKDTWSKTTKFYVNDVFVCKCEVGSDYYCTVSRSGNPSNIRNRRKKTYRTNWQIGNILGLIGVENFTALIFKDDYPDLKFGHQGSIVTRKKIKEIFSQYLLLKEQEVQVSDTTKML